jgi:hypothetical protein
VHLEHVPGSRTLDVARALPSHGLGWDAAVEYGIDVTLIERNLALSTEDRLRQLDDMLRTYFALRP